MSNTFKRKIENFTCEHCGAQVAGSGYTNHCPQCLWSKHVDINPGDRQATCGGLMFPQKLVLEHGEQHLIHKCQKCGYEKKNKVQAGDNREEILRILNF